MSNSIRSAFLLLTSAATIFACAQASEHTEDPALDDLRAAAEHAHSDAVFILRDGESIAEWYFGSEPRPIELMSVLKSVVSLGVGRLVTQGKIDSLDQPVHAFYPEWERGPKRVITVRHLLNHTSGLQNVPDTRVEIYPSPSAVQLALDAGLPQEPGSAFRYNNKAVNLLSGLIEKVSGQRMDHFFEGEFFGPMEIEEYTWGYDPSGTPYAMAGLALHARDLAKFGQLVLDGGRWEGERLVSEDYIKAMLAPSQPHFPLHGLLWWRLPGETRFTFDESRMDELAAAGVATEDLRLLQPFVGRTFTGWSEAYAALYTALGPDWREVLTERFQGPGVSTTFRMEYDDIVGYYGDGYLGQTLLIIPSLRVVAVRQVASGQNYNPTTDGFESFKEMVLQAVAELRAEVNG